MRDLHKLVRHLEAVIARQRGAGRSDADLATLDGWAAEVKRLLDGPTDRVLRGHLEAVLSALIYLAANLGDAAAEQWAEGRLRHLAEQLEGRLAERQGDHP